MKTVFNLSNNLEKFNKFSLSNNDLIKVKGGEEDPVVKPPTRKQ